MNKVSRVVGAPGLEPGTSSLVPDELPEKIDNLVGLSGLEPETSSLSVTRSNQLSYSPDNYQLAEITALLAPH